MPKTDQPAGDRDAQGRLTYAALVRTFQEGGTVILGTQHVTRVEDLPSEAVYVQGDAEAEADALKRLEQTRALIDVQIASLKPKSVKPAGK